MPVETALIIQPAIDFTAFLGLAHETLGYNLAGSADASHQKMMDPKKFLSCLAAFKDESAEITTNLLSHVSFGVLVITDERSLFDVLQVASDMPFVRALAAPCVEMVIISGTLGQWRDAVVSGTGEDELPTVRTCYSQILLLFDHAGLTSIWSDFERGMALDRSGFLLERR